jgi:hypothetical protein
VRSRLLALAAAAEVLAAIVLTGLAWWCWQHGVHITMRHGVMGHGVALRRVEGRWWATATGVATLAGILLLHAGAALAVRGERPA